MQTDDANLYLSGTNSTVDSLNSDFYGRFPYPQLPYSFDYLENPDFERIMVMQDIGDWKHTTLPRMPRVWVAGCGTNQGIITALRFPQGSILGSDLSQTSLDLSTRNMNALGIRNAWFKRESINTVPYTEEFDYIVCTGVIHHNSDPMLPLSRLSRALKATGILELMVYNQYYWSGPAGFQKAVRVLAETTESPDFVLELAIAKRMLSSLPEGRHKTYLQNYRGSSDEVLADLLIQPVLHGYTIASVCDLVQSSSLHIVSHCPNMHDAALGILSWEFAFEDKELQARYDALPDQARWQITNLLRFDQMPYLWFYCMRDDSPFERKTLEVMNAEFLQTTFSRVETTRRSFRRDERGEYKLSPKAIPYPSRYLKSNQQQILAQIDGKTTMGAILDRCSFDKNFQSINSIRVALATSAFPYVVAPGGV